MSITHFKKNQYRSMKWLNGGGETFELAIHPSNTELAQRNFLWRLSWANVASSGPFSLFEGYERLLVIWQGAGMKLNGRQMRPWEILSFPGSERIESELLDGSVQDLGVVYRKDSVAVSMACHRFSGAKNFISEHVSFLFCGEGLLQGQGKEIRPGECFQLLGKEEITLKTLRPSGLIEIKITER